ncbi:ABC transporter [Acidihalobacter prosperus]|uniref:ABC transporter n=2 Tax=Acidihalobacter prosperus TaxID=160660 RepID=A0A1A6C8S7_9GAMM|nr:ABC transporter [Acidihalobacter prosperus]
MERMTADSSAPVAVAATALCKSVAGPEGALQILDGVELQVAHGESVAILGASGSGKSTLLGLLAGLDSPSSGEVRLAGEALSALDEDGRARVRAGRVGFVFQSFQLLPGLTALENVMLPLELQDRAARAPALEVLARVGLAARAAHYPHQLSGGEQQRVAIARAFVTRPAVLFADEPTGNLDETSGAQVIDLLFSLNDEQATALVLVTHDAVLAARCARRYRLQAGRLAPC